MKDVTEGHEVKIRLILYSGAEPIEIEVEKGTKIRDVYLEFEDAAPYTVLLAKVNNRYAGLTERIEEPCSIEFLDMRSHVGRLVYQHGLIMIYLKAVEETMGRQKVEVMAALSKGLYTEINDGEEIPDEALDAIRQRMNEIVEKDMQFFKVTADRKAAKMEFEWAGLSEKLRIVEQFKNVDKFVYYSLDGFINFFYGVMVPSTSYITGFEVKRYRRGILLALPEKREGSGLQYIDDRKLYSAFMQTKKWQKVLGTQFVLDLNNKIRKGEAKEIIQLSEALHEQNIIELAQRIIKEKKRIILISGPSSSGKTTFARRLCIQLKVNGKKPLYLGTDDYFKNREDTPLNEKGEKDYECLEAVEVEMFNRDMNALLGGQKFDLAEFDVIEGVKK